MEISNLVTEPSSTGMRFLIHGDVTVDEKKNEKKGAIVSLDFTKVFDSNCKESDY